jgi:hypothetical protein
VKSIGPNRSIKALSGAAVLWTFLPNDGSPASEIHHTFRREAWREASVGDRMFLCLGFVLWAPTTMYLAVTFTRRCGPEVRARTGKGLLRQLREQLGLALRVAVPPPWYYMFEFFDDAKRRRAAEYLYRFETKAALYDFLRAKLSAPEVYEPLSDKALFATHCEAGGVRAVRSLGTVIDGTIRQADGSDGLPCQHMFFKPIRGAGGHGAERWMLQDDGSYQGGDGAVMSATDLHAHAVELSRQEPYVIRELLTQHRDIADLSAGALCTARVVSVLDENGQPEVTNAVLRMASDASAVVDNFHAGGIAAEIDLGNGKLTRATSMGLTGHTSWYDVHPATGGVVTGRQLPFWSEILQLTRSAHELFPGYPAIGWDVAILDDGPCLVEGNKSPDLDILQRIGRRPLGNERYGQLFLFHLRRALDTVHDTGRTSSPPGLEDVA